MILKRAAEVSIPCTHLGEKSNIECRDLSADSYKISLSKQNIGATIPARKV